MQSEQRGGRSSSAPRPAVDLVVPFAGSEEALSELIERLARVRLRETDTLTVVDNRPAGRSQEPPEFPRGRLVRAPERQSSYFARNRGAAGGSAEWIVFIDADTEPSPTLLDDYFETPPGDPVAILAGGITDVGPQVGERRSAARLYAERARILDQLDSVEREDRPGFAKTANVAYRRTAFEAVGGFRNDVRSGGDADMCIRVQRAGWQMESREQARVLHHGRTTLRALMRQYAKWGSGAEYFNRIYPGFHPPKGAKKLASITTTRIGGAARALLRGDRDGATTRLVDLLAVWSWEVGRLFPNRVR